MSRLAMAPTIPHMAWDWDEGGDFHCLKKRSSPRPGDRGETIQAACSWPHVALKARERREPEPMRIVRRARMPAQRNGAQRGCGKFDGARRTFSRTRHAMAARRATADHRAKMAAEGAT